MFDPWVGKISWRRKWQSTPVFLPGEFHGQRSLVGYGPQDRKESDTTEWLTHTRIYKMDRCPSFIMGIKEGLLHIKDPIFTVNLQTTPGNMLNYYLWIYCWFVKTSDSEGWVNHTPWWMHSSIIYLYRPPLTDLFIPFYSTPHSHPSISQRTFIVLICVFCLDLVSHSV